MESLTLSPERPERRIAVHAFHDERMVAGWLYHGFVIVEHGHWGALRDYFREARLKVGCAKPVHFVDLKGHSRGSMRTALARRWVQGLEGELLNMCRFFLLGIDLAKAEHRFFGDDTDTKAEKEMRRYNRFFEMALYIALRWFFTEHEEVILRRIVAEKRSLRGDDPFLSHSPYKLSLRESNITVATREVKVVAAKDPECSQPAAADALQLADVLVGTFSMVLDATSKSDGCCELAELAAPRVKKLNDSPFNVRSRTWKRLAMRFFPREVSNAKLEMYEHAGPQMYEKRELKFLAKDQPMLPF